MSQRKPIGGLLYPQQNLHRNLLDLSSIWEFQLDPDEVGERQQWFSRLPSPRFIPVPGNWNDQFDDAKNYLGLAWYRKEVTLPPVWKGQRVFIRVGSANYTAKVWINGKEVGSHEGGHLPFVLEVTKALFWNKANVIAISVENKPLPERVPAGPSPTASLFNGPFAGFPATTYDFFPYAGLHRAVQLFTVPQAHIEDLTVVTGIEGKDGTVSVSIKTTHDAKGSVQLEGQSINFSTKHNQAKVTLRVPKARFWNPNDPHLYPLEVTLKDGRSIGVFLFFLAEAGSLTDQIVGLMERMVENV